MFKKIIDFFKSIWEKITGFFKSIWEKIITFKITKKNFPYFGTAICLLVLLVIESVSHSFLVGIIIVVILIIFLIVLGKVIDYVESKLPEDKSTKKKK